MATYNKRGYKPKTKPEKEEEDFIDESESTTAEVFGTLDEGANRTEEWVSKNQTTIIATIAVIALGAFGYWAYTQFVLGPKEQEAVAESMEADKYYSLALNSLGDQQDSLYDLALNGVNGKYGLIKITEEYAGTDAGNLANYKAGMAYLNIGGDKYQKAIDYLSAYDGGDSVLESIAQAGIGDALVQVGQASDAIAYYMNAAEINANEFTTPKYLLKAAQAAIKAGQNDTAKTALERIENDYKDSDEFKTAQALLGQVSAK